MCTTCTCGVRVFQSSGETRRPTVQQPVPPAVTECHYILVENKNKRVLHVCVPKNTWVAAVGAFIFPSLAIGNKQ